MGRKDGGRAGVLVDAVGGISGCTACGEYANEAAGNITLAEAVGDSPAFSQAHLRFNTNGINVHRQAIGRVGGLGIAVAINHRVLWKV